MGRSEHVTKYMSVGRPRHLGPSTWYLTYGAAPSPPLQLYLQPLTGWGDVQRTVMSSSDDDEPLSKRMKVGVYTPQFIHRVCVLRQLVLNPSALSRIWEPRSSRPQPRKLRLWTRTLKTMFPWDSGSQPR